jgi:hypothetical protein
MVGSKGRPEISGNLEAREMMAIRLTAEVVTPGNRVPLGLRVPLPRTAQSAQEVEDLRHLPYLAPRLS